MIVRELRESEKNEYNKLVKHPLQSWEWGEFREKMGQKTIRLGVFDDKKMVNGYQILLSRIPKTSFTIGTLLRGPIPDLLMINSLKKIGQSNNAIFIKMEPLLANPVKAESDSPDQNAYGAIENFLIENNCQPGKPLFPKHTFYLDITKSEEELLKNMHPKTRYNINLAQKHGVEVTEDNTPEGFEIFLKLHFETAEREGFYSHSHDYHRQMWRILSATKTAHLLISRYQGIPLAAWVLFTFNNTLFYPYGGSSREHREVMPSYAMMWSAICFGKKAGCKNFDMWGTPGPNPGPKDPWIGFHKFKLGFGPQLMEFFGTFDLVINYSFYSLYNTADKLRWNLLKLRAKASTIVRDAKNYASQYTSII